MSWPSYAQQRKWREEGRTPRRRPFTLDPLDFLRPGWTSSWPPHGVSLEQTFEAIAGLARSANDAKYVSQLQWGTCGPIQQMSPESGLSSYGIEPVKNLDDLRQRFHHVWLGSIRSEGVRRWKEEQGIGLDKPLAVPVKTYREYLGLDQIGFSCEDAIRKTFTRLCEGDAGSKMAVALNGCHPRIARTLHHTRVSFTREGRFRFVLSFGDKHPKDHGSQWGDTIAVSREGETFVDTLARARDIHDLLVHGKTFPCRSIAEDFDILIKGNVLYPGWYERQIAGILDGIPVDTDAYPKTLLELTRRPQERLGDERRAA